MFIMVFAGAAMAGVPTDVPPGATGVLEYLFLLLATPLVLGALGFVLTYGGTVVAGAATGYLLARR